MGMAHMLGITHVCSIHTLCVLANTSEATIISPLHFTQPCVGLRPSFLSSLMASSEDEDAIVEKLESTSTAEVGRNSI